MEDFMSESTNPLFKHFRQPQLYIRLPSNGNFYPQGSIDIPVTKEFPVYAMTAKDELTLKTPDALLNGQATVDVIQSCMPNIKNAWHVPAIDLDHILISIRRATYGDGMEFSTICPHCQQKNEQVLNLQALGNNIDHNDYNSPVITDGLEIYLKPADYYTVNRMNLESYENQRLISVVRDQTIPEQEKITKYNELFKRILDTTVAEIANSVAAIKVDGKLVDDPKHIDEFFRNCSKSVWDPVKNQLEKVSAKNELLKIQLICEYEDCKKEYTTPLLFDTSNFFV